MPKSRPEPPKGSFTDLERHAVEAKRNGQGVRVNDDGDFISLDTVASIPANEDAPVVQAPESPEPLEVPQITMYDPTAEQEPEQPEVDLSQYADVARGSLEDSPPPTEAAPEPQQKGPCPRCGWGGEPVSEEPSVADKLEFVRSILGGRRFTKALPFLNGRVTVVLRSLTAGEIQGITDRLARERGWGYITTEMEWLNKWRRYTLACMLQSVSGGESETKIYPEVTPTQYPLRADVKHDSVYAVAADTLEEGWSSGLHGLLHQSLTVFEDTYNQLLARSQDPDFWQGLPD